MKNFTFEHINKILEGFVLLCGPLLEVTIHEKKTKKICQIIGKISNRKIGDDSYIDWDMIKAQNTVIYEKIIINNKIIKSVSISLDNYVVCINFDITIFNELYSYSSLLIEKKNNDNINYLLKNDWKEKINVFVFQYIKNQNKTIEKLNNKEKKEIIKIFMNENIFKEKNSSNYIAELLKINRSTIFKYIKEIKNEIKSI